MQFSRAPNLSPWPGLISTPRLIQSVSIGYGVERETGVWTVILTGYCFPGLDCAFFLSGNSFRVDAPAFGSEKIKSKAGNTYAATRRAKISQNLANAPLDYNAIFVYAELPQSLWRLLHGGHWP